MRVDVHAHVMPKEAMGRAGTYGPEIRETDDGLAVVRVGPYSSRIGGSKGLSAEQMRKLHDPKLRLAEMDAKGIDVMGLSVSPLFYLYWAEPSVAIPFATVQNEGLAGYCCADPDRLFFMATLPLPGIDASIKELDRAVALGAKGVNIGTGGFGDLDLDSDEMWPLYARIEELGLPVFVHPYPLPMADGKPDRYNMSWIFGYTYQESLAYASLLLGGVFDDFPDLKVILTHGGGNAPYQFGRLEEAQARQPDVRAKRPIREYRSNVYFDILVHDLAARRLLLDFAGPEQLVIGDNYGGWDAADGVALLDELELAPDEKEMIGGTNAAALFKLAPRTAAG
jgi:aminocarboxymuconate-semialdehyde decarboxylase